MAVKDDMSDLYGVIISESTVKAFTNRELLPL